MTSIYMNNHLQLSEGVEEKFKTPIAFVIVERIRVLLKDDVLTITEANGPALVGPRLRARKVKGKTDMYVFEGGASISPDDVPTSIRYGDFAPFPAVGEARFWKDGAKWKLQAAGYDTGGGKANPRGWVFDAVEQ